MGIACSRALSQQLPSLLYAFRDETATHLNLQELCTYSPSTLSRFAMPYVFTNGDTNLNSGNIDDAGFTALVEVTLFIEDR